METKLHTHGGVVLHLPDLVNGFVDVVDTIMANGDDVAPDGKMTRELLAMTLVIPGDAPMLPFGTGRKVNRRLAAEDALQVIGGFSSLERFERINPNMRNYTNQGAFHGGYGPRIRPQLGNVLRRLTADPSSRRAVITIWDPLRDGNIEGMSNYPCTTELQFMIRGEKLDLHTTMRANDVWHGLTYDAFVFNQLQRTVARMLMVDVGTYYHHATSLHVYEKQWELVPDLHILAEYTDAHFTPNGLPSDAVARYIADKDYDSLAPYAFDEAVGWYDYFTNTAERGE
jgi:thymidylate synthase